MIIEILAQGQRRGNGLVIEFRDYIIQLQTGNLRWSNRIQYNDSVLYTVRKVQLLALILCQRHIRIVQINRIDT
ncbi:hypothetical protein D3C76_1685380 [compost metagenome]